MTLLAVSVARDELEPGLVCEALHVMLDVLFQLSSFFLPQVQSDLLHPFGQEEFSDVERHSDVDVLEKDIFQEVLVREGRQIRI